MKRIFKVIIIICLCIITMLVAGAIGYTCLHKNNQKEVQTVEKIKEEKVIVPEEVVTIEPETMYTTDAVNLRDAPGMDSNIITVLSINTEVKKIGEDGEWSKIQWSETEIYYIYSTYLSYEKTEIVVQTQPSYNMPSGGGVLTKSKGVNYFNGHKETWYSQRVLPGPGLRIPGRHVADDGTIRDENNYIVVASSDYAWGTIVETSLGTGKVYDSGCDSGIIDIYTDW